MCPERKTDPGVSESKSYISWFTYNHIKLREAPLKKREGTSVGAGLPWSSFTLQWVSSWQVRKFPKCRVGFSYSLIGALYFGNDSHLGAPKAVRITCIGIEFYNSYLMRDKMATPESAPTLRGGRFFASS